MENFLLSIVFILLITGLFLIFSDVFKLPLHSVSRAMRFLARDKKVSKVETEIEKYSKRLAKILPMNEFKREHIKSSLVFAGLNISAEEYTASAMIKSLIIALFAIPAYFVFPYISGFFIILAIFRYRSQFSKLDYYIEKKRREIEEELPRFILVIQKTLKHRRDVIYMVEYYTKFAGDSFKEELITTSADMKSGSIENALVRLESRVGSAQMSDVCRGLEGVIGGDDTTAYWNGLYERFRDMQHQELKRKAQKIPRKVTNLSILILMGFIATFFTVIIYQAITSLGGIMNM